MLEETDKKKLSHFILLFFSSSHNLYIALKNYVEGACILVQFNQGVYVVFFFQLKIQLNINNLDRVWLKELCRSENNWHKVVNFEKTISMQF